MVEKGLLLIMTGEGKGKTTSAVGLALRAFGAGLSVIILQFIKGEKKYGELYAIKKLQEIDNKISIKQCGKGFTKRGDKSEEEHRNAALSALKEAKDALKNFDMVILDEILYAAQFGLITEDELFSVIDEKDAHTHLVLTGRGASEKLIERADLVSDIKCVKHPFQKGIAAQAGIEF